MSVRPPQPRMTLPVFPLGETALLPHSLLPLHIFEPRYRQMIDVVQRTNGRFVMATIERREDHCRLREAACTARLISSEALPDGRSNVLIHGTQRVRILSVIEPDCDRLYHMVRVEPIEPHDESDRLPPKLRRRLMQVLDNQRLSDLHPIQLLRQHVRDKDIELPIIVDMIGSSILHCHEQRYAFLAEPDPARRADIAIRELRSLNRLIEHAELLSADRNWPAGLSWN